MICTPSRAVLRCRDLSRARSFYEELFGWTGTPVSDSTVVEHRDRLPVAVINESPTTWPPAAGWLTVVEASSADLVVEHAEAGEGAVVDHCTIPAVGSVTTIEAPPGVTIGVIDADGDASWFGAQHGAPQWTQLNTTNPQTSAELVSRAFGWALGESDNDGFTYWNFVADGDPVAAMMAIDERSGAIPSVWELYFAVDDVDAITSRALDLGATVMVQPTQIAPCDFAVLADPAGELFGVQRLRR